MARIWIAAAAAAVGVAAVAAVLLVAQPGQMSGMVEEQMPAEEQIVVYASFFPYYEFAKGVAGDDAQVVQLIPGGADAHDWEPSPGQVRALSSANVFVYNGLGLEPYTEQMERSQEFGNLEFVPAGRSVSLIYGYDDSAMHAAHAHDDDHGDEHADEEDHGDEERHDDDDHGDEHADEEDHGDEERHDDDHGDEKHDDDHADDADPHVWLDPARAKVQVDVIADAMSRVDPARADAYRGNAAAYKAELDALHQYMSEKLQNCDGRAFVTLHPAFEYLADRYGLEQVNIGRASAELSAAEISGAIETLAEAQTSVIFGETAKEPRFAEVLAAETGASVRLLDTLESPSESYLQAMRYNADTLAGALDCL